MPTIEISQEVYEQLLEINPTPEDAILELLNTWNMEQEDLAPIKVVEPITSVATALDAVTHYQPTLDVQLTEQEVSTEPPPLDQFLRKFYELKRTRTCDKLVVEAAGLSQRHQAELARIYSFLNQKDWGGERAEELWQNSCRLLAIGKEPTPK